MASEAETPLSGGWVTHGVVRVGETVRRPAGPNAEFVRQLLDALEARGFREAPRHLGIDDEGREILSFLEGDVPSDCRSTVWRDEQLEACTALLRSFHDATAMNDLTGDQEVVCHNDFGPWNLVWRDGRPVAIIDFDNAAPGGRLDDLGYAIWKHLNIGLLELPVSEQGRRLRVMTSTYGVPADESVIAAIGRAQDRMGQVIAAAAPSDLRNEALEQHVREVEWLRTNGERLVSA